MGFIQNIFGVENRSANETPEINTSSFESKEGVQEPKSNTDENNNLLEFYNGYISVGKDNIRQEPTYKQAGDIISSAIASCPVYLYKEGKDGKIERMYGDYREQILNGEVNEFMGSYEFKKKYSLDVHEFGSAFAMIERNGNTITRLLYAKNGVVSEYEEKNDYGIVDKIIYRASGKDIKDDMLLASKNGIGAYKTCRNEVENYINLVNQEGSLILNMARPSGILETEGRLNSKTATNLKKAWENLYNGVKNAGKTVVLEEGLKYKPLSQQEMISNKEAKDVIEKMIEKGCNIPVGYITGGNITSELKNEFYNRALKPIMSAMIDEFNRSLLLEEEKEQGYYFEFDTMELLKVTYEELSKAVIAEFKGGVIKLNEARERLDYKSIENGNTFVMSLGNVFYNEDTKEYYTPNTGETKKNNEKVKDIA